jgi:hypothetical protein
MSDDDNKKAPHVQEYIENFFPSLDPNPFPNRIITNIQDLATKSNDENVTENNHTVENASPVHSDTMPQQRRMTNYGILELTGTTPHHNDVLCGRGVYRIHNHHPGNAQYRRLVYQKAGLFLKAKLKSEKQQVVSMILNEVRNLDPPGRFLMKGDDEDSSLWYDIGDKKAQYKIYQSLRGKSSAGIDSGSYEHCNSGQYVANEACTTVVATLAEGRHPNRKTESALRLAEGCTINVKSLGAESANLNDKDDINAQKKRIAVFDKSSERESALKLAEGYTRTIMSLRAELTHLTDEDEINAQKKRIAMLNRKRDEALEKA